MKSKCLAAVQLGMGYFAGDKENGGSLSDWLDSCDQRQRRKKEEEVASG